MWIYLPGVVIVVGVAVFREPAELNYLEALFANSDAGSCWEGLFPWLGINRDSHRLADHYQEAPSNVEETFLETSHPHSFERRVRLNNRMMNLQASITKMRGIIYGKNS